MDKNKYKKLSIDFPLDHYARLKLVCIYKGVSIRDFVTQAIIKSLEEEKNTGL